MRLHKLLFLFVAGLLMHSCNQDDASTPLGGDNFSTKLGSQITADFSGQIVDTDNNPLVGVSIKIGSSTTQTDENGVFFLDDAAVYQKLAFVSASKLGYFDGSRSLVPTSGRNHVKIMMLPLTSVGTVQAGETGEITLDGGTKITFDGSFVDENNTAYSGEVNVAAFHLLPSNENLTSLMPGMLFGENEADEAVALETFGMLNVELRGSEGQELQIANGHTASVEFAIDNTQSAAAPATIPLWHFDQTKGYWIEEGIATKNGNVYVGEVSHFSWWNCDAPFDTIVLSVKVLNEAGQAIPNVKVGLVRNGNIIPVSGVTDGNGQVSGFIPANETLTLNVYRNCSSTSTIVYTTTIGPFATDTTLPDISLPIAEFNTTQVTGVLNNCDNEPVTHGYVLLSYADGINFIVPVTNGTFSTHLVVCTGTQTVNLEGVDFEVLENVEMSNVPITFPLTDIGTISTCNQVTGELNYQLDNGPVITSTDNIRAKLVGGELQILCGNQQLDFFNAVTTTGQYSNVTTVHGLIITPGYTTTSSMFYINVTELGAVGELVKMTFEGYCMVGGQQVFLFGDVEAIREE